ncbi:MAG: phasin family protein [Thermodesulfobacteriota bacterium]
MLDLFKKAALLGMGMVSLTEDKMMELVEEMEKKGEVSSKEGRDSLEKLFSKVEEERKAGEEKLREILSTSLSKVNIATREEIERLEKKIHTLEKKVAELAKKGGGE